MGKKEEFDINAILSQHLTNLENHLDKRQEETI
jgi:hypothetical protein